MALCCSCSGILVQWIDRGTEFSDSPEPFTDSSQGLFRLDDGFSVPLVNGPRSDSETMVWLSN